MKQSSSLSSAFLGFLLFIALVSYGHACIEKFKRSSEMNNFTKGCLVKSGFDKDSLPTVEDMLKSDFDDKCAAKCIFGSFEVVDDKGHLDRDLFTDFLEDNSPPTMVLKLTELASSCADTAGTDTVTGTKQGTTPDECKPFGTFYNCFVTAANNLC